MARTTPPAATEHESPPLIVGPLTIDVIDGARLPGGAVSYAARAAQALGRVVRILTVAGPDADTAGLGGHEVEVVQAEATLTFEHDSANDGTRSLRVVAAPGHTLAVDDLPEEWRDGPAPSVVILAPLLPRDVDVASFASIVPRRAIALLGQGMQREQRQDGAVAHAAEPTPELLEACTHAGTLFLSEDETAPWSNGELERVAATVPKTVITRGADGADVLQSDGTCHIDAVAAEAVDSTGAGDVFATTYVLGAASGVPRPGRLAAALAAAATEVRGPEALPSWRDLDGAGDRSGTLEEREAGR